MMALCVSGKNSKPFQYTQVEGVMCKYFCPTADSANFESDGIIRHWSVDEDWRRKPGCDGLNNLCKTTDDPKIINFRPWTPDNRPSAPRKPTAG